MCIRDSIMMRGNGRVEQYKGNIVGFSNRLNTILVPQSFMKWANENFAPNAEAPVSYTHLQGVAYAFYTSCINRPTIR